MFLQSAEFGMTCWILIKKKEVSSAQEIVWLYICSLKTLPNIVLQVAQTSYRWGSRAVGECSCCLLMQLEEQPPEETVHAWR